MDAFKCLFITGLFLSPCVKDMSTISIPAARAGFNPKMSSLQIHHKWIYRYVFRTFHEGHGSREGSIAAGAEYGARSA